MLSVCAQLLNHFRLFATPWKVASQALPSMGFPERVGCHFLLQGVFLTRGSYPRLLDCHFTAESPGKPKYIFSLPETTMCCCCYLLAKWCPILLQPHGQQPTRVLCPWNSPGKNTGVSSYSLLQGIFPTQGSNLPLLLWQMDSLPLRHQGRPQATRYEN